MFRCDGMDDHLAHQALRFIEWRRRSLESFTESVPWSAGLHGRLKRHGWNRTFGEQPQMSKHPAAALPRDCTCVTHDGPHWLHMDRLWAERNQEIRRRFDAARASGNYLDAYLAGLAYAQEEAHRLAEKSRQMRLHGIEDLRDLVPQP